MMARDFNAETKPDLDTSGQALPSDFGPNMCKSLGLLDVQRLFEPEARNDAFYSKPHESYSRIEAFCVTQDVLSNVWNSEIHNIIHSDL